jgi:hypothetical protein
MPLQPESIEIRRAGGNQRAPAVAAMPTSQGQGGYLVVWEDHLKPGDADIHGRRVGGQGNPLDAPYLAFAGSARDETSPAVAGNESNHQFLITWTRRVTDPQTPWVTWDLIHARSMGWGGSFRCGATHAGGSYDSDHSALVAGPTGDFLIVFDDPALTMSIDIYGRLWGNRVYLPGVLRRP